MSTPATNDITGDRIKSKENTDKFRSGYDLIFGKKPVKATCRKCPADPAKTCDYCGWQKC